MPEQTCVYPVCAGSLRGQKRALGPLESELQAIVSHDVGVENGTSSSARAVSAFNH